MKSTHAYYWGNIRDQLRERHEKVRAEVRAVPGIDRTFHVGRLMADYEVQALIEQLPTRGNESFLFEVGFTIREAAERATRDSEPARREVEHSDDPDRMFHSGRAANTASSWRSCNRTRNSSGSPSRRSLSTGSIRTGTSVNRL